MLSLFYFTTKDFTWGEKGILQQRKVFSPWQAKQFDSWEYEYPKWLTRHYDQGLDEGYIQREGDSDNTGRLDHLLANAYVRSLFLFATDIIRSRNDSEGSPTDTFVNGLGRDLHYFLATDRCAKKVTPDAAIE